MEGRGGFAVGTGYGNSVFQSASGSASISARGNNGNFHFVRFDDFRVVGLHGGGKSRQRARPVGN